MSPRRTLRVATLIACCLAPALLPAQGTGPGYSGSSTGGPYQPGPIGTVTGTVIDQDTQHPVRLANVSLQPIQQSSQTNGIRQGVFMHNGGQRTGLDGTFTIEGVAPGDYYITAVATGYIPERSLLQAQIAAGAKLEDVLRQIPTVHIDANGTASVVVNIQHGGAIGGRVQWDDGTPADGVQINAQPSASYTSTGAFVAQPSLPFTGVENYSRNNTVDDRGDFRISGLAPGDYIVTATVMPDFSRSVPTSPLRIYSPGVFRVSEATPVTVRAGDERSDLRLVLRLNDLHTVSGTVGAASGSAAVHSGRVSLTDSNDTTLRRISAIASDGSFTIRYVPPGNFTMTVSGSSQEAPNGYRRGTPTAADTTITFAPITQPLQVGSTDISGLSINLAAR